MTRHLVVLHDTQPGPELVSALSRLRAEDAHAAFSLLVTKTELGSRWLWTEGESELAARAALAEARAMLRHERIPVESARTGDVSPMQAIADERRRGAAFDAIVLSTPPTRIARGLRLDAASRARQFGVPLMAVRGERRALPAPRREPP